MTKEMEIITEYLRSPRTDKMYKQAMTPYAMVRLTSRVTMLDGNLLKTLICIARVSVLGVTDRGEHLYEKVMTITKITRNTFYLHMRKLKAEGAIKEFGPFLLVNPMYVAIGKRLEVNRLYEIYNGIEPTITPGAVYRGSRKLKNLRHNGLLSALSKAEGFRNDQEVIMARKHGV